jgi:hypothetical protein
VIVALVPAVVAWLGASLLVVSDGRLALGTGLTAAAGGVAAGLIVGGRPLAAAAVVAGGLASAALRLRTGPAGWRILPPHSSPRVILSVGAGGAAAWIAAQLLGVGGLDRMPAVMVAALAGGRVLGAADGASAAVAASAVALAVPVALLGGSDTATLAAGAASATAVAVATLPVPRPRRA